MGSRRKLMKIHRESNLEASETNTLSDRFTAQQNDVAACKCLVHSGLPRTYEPVANGDVGALYRKGCGSGELR
jgi:hypothetical protein